MFISYIWCMVFPLLDEYHAHRLVTGLAEGVEEIPVARCFPLEYNLDLQRGGQHCSFFILFINYLLFS